MAEVNVDGHPPLKEGACRVIAEAGVNHHNSVEHAIEMAHVAAAAGAWAIKFQLYKADSLAVPDSPKYWKDRGTSRTQYESFAGSDRLDYAEYGAVAEACRELGIIFFATPFDDRAVDALEEMQAPIYKIASGDITHRPLIERVSATGMPVLLSTGASTAPEIADAIAWSGLGPDRLVLLACTLAYPTADVDGHFARLKTFRSEFAPYLSGTSDHTRGVLGAAMTGALGGVCIEKHYTLDKNATDVPDHRISVDGPELAELVAVANRSATLRGESWIGVRESEEPARLNARRSIVLRHPVSAGMTLRQEDIDFRRPGNGFAPSELGSVVGRMTTHNLSASHVIGPDDLADPRPT
jgi:sialic acid synthase SpsE